MTRLVQRPGRNGARARNRTTMAKNKDFIFSNLKCILPVVEVVGGATAQHSLEFPPPPLSVGNNSNKDVRSR